MEYLFLCPNAGLAFHFFLIKKRNNPPERTVWYGLEKSSPPAGVAGLTTI